MDSNQSAALLDCIWHHSQSEELIRSHIRMYLSLLTLRCFWSGWVCICKMIKSSIFIFFTMWVTWLYSCSVSYKSYDCIWYPMNMQECQCYLYLHYFMQFHKNLKFNSYMLFHAIQIVSQFQHKTGQLFGQILCCSYWSLYPFENP